MIYIPVDIYMSSVVVFLNQEEFDIKKMHSILLRHSNKTKNPKESYKIHVENFTGVHKQYFIDNHYSGVASYSGLISIIILEKFDFKDYESHDSLSHEIRHVVDNILRNCAMENVWENREAYAYLHGWITGQVYKQILKENL